MLTECTETRLRQEIQDAASQVLEQAHIQFAEILKRNDEKWSLRLKALEDQWRRTDFVARSLLVGLEHAAEAVLSFTDQELRESDTIISIGGGD